MLLLNLLNKMLNIILSKKLVLLKNKFNENLANGNAEKRMLKNKCKKKYLIENTKTSRTNKILYRNCVNNYVGRLKELSLKIESENKLKN